ncbi:hypothetical protein J6590_083594 [Homalodisca vitripennis]|nr:hypothetical protein J6590_083594 [Homalodisca vitripennis]
MSVTTGNKAIFVAIICLNFIKVIAQNETQCHCKCNQPLVDSVNKSYTENLTMDMAKKELSKISKITNSTFSGGTALKLKGNKTDAVDTKNKLNGTREIELNIKNSTIGEIINETTSEGNFLTGTFQETLKIEENSVPRNITVKNKTGAKTTPNYPELLPEDTKNIVVIDQKQQRGDIEVNESEITVQEQTKKPEIRKGTKTEISRRISTENYRLTEESGKIKSEKNIKLDQLKKITPKKTKEKPIKKQESSRKFVQENTTRTKPLQKLPNFETTTKKYLLKNNDTYKYIIYNDNSTVSPLLDLLVRYFVQLENKKLDNDELLYGQH